jgi:hypothetical protein
MSENNDQTNSGPPEFDFSRFPFNTLFHERRNGLDRRDRKGPDPLPEKPAAQGPPPERRARKDRRRRIDPTTFDKQYTDDEMEFMNAMQRFKERSGKSFPTYREVIRVLVDLGYRRAIVEADNARADAYLDEPVLISESTVDA